MCRHLAPPPVRLASAGTFLLCRGHDAIIKIQLISQFASFVAVFVGKCEFFVLINWNLIEPLFACVCPEYRRLIPRQVEELRLFGAEKHEKYFVSPLKADSNNNERSCH